MINIKKIRSLIIYIAFMIINSIITFPGQANFLWRYDKYIHFFEFLILGFLILNIFKPIYNIYNSIYAFLLLLLFALIDEGIQFYIPGRIPDIYDLMFDVIGGTAGIIISYLYFKIKIKSKNG